MPFLKTLSIVFLQSMKSLNLYIIFILYYIYLKILRIILISEYLIYHKNNKKGRCNLIFNICFKKTLNEFKFIFVYINHILFG